MARQPQKSAIKRIAMDFEATGTPTRNQQRVSLTDLYRAGLTPAQDTFVWKTVGLHLLVAVAVAVAVRLPYYRDGWRPLNDGGMFALLLDQLREHGLRWPTYIDYNHLHLPLGYPPLGFYLGVLATYLPMQNTQLVMTWLPLLFNLATVVAAYFIAYEVFADPFQRLMTAVVYAIIGWSSMWLTMGGGITRSPGEFFALTAIALFLRACNRQSWKITVFCGIFGGLTLLTHLECSVLLVVSLPVLALSFPRRWQNLYRMVAAGAVGTLVALPWIFWVWTHLGFAPLVNAFHSGFDTAHYDFSVLLIVAAGVLFAWAAHFPYVLWLVTEFLLMRRNPNTHSVVIRAIILVWVASVIVVLFSRVSRSLWWQRAVAAALAVAMALPMLGTIQKKNDRLEDLATNVRAQLSPTEIAAMQAVPNYTAPDARFIVLSQRTEYWFEDSASEWFPYYSGRQCLNTAQGREWLPNRDFARAVKVSGSLMSLGVSPNFDDLIYYSKPDYLMIVYPLDENHQAIAQIYRRLTRPIPLYKNYDAEVLAFDPEKLSAAATKYAAATGGAIPK